MILDRNKIIKNAFVLSTNNTSFIAIYVNSSNNSYRICELKNKPFAMFECKRVGVEEGMRKGPQTIEKAKQGSYVARTVSSLQRIRYDNGSLGGLIQKKDGTFLIGDYYTLLGEIVNSEDAQILEDFIPTVGIMTNYFKQNENKINSWFNIITPKARDLNELKNELILLSNKNWWSV
jgi:hypothetical protein